MPFPLSDLRRRYGRGGSAGGPPDVRPYLLAGKELRAQEADASVPAGLDLPVVRDTTGAFRASYGSGSTGALWAGAFPH